MISKSEEERQKIFFNKQFYILKDEKKLIASSNNLIKLRQIIRFLGEDERYKIILYEDIKKEYDIIL